MTCEVTLCPFRDTLPTPCNQHILRKTSIGVRHFDIGELHSTFGEFFNQIIQFTICRIKPVRLVILILMQLKRRRGECMAGLGEEQEEGR